MNAVFAQWKSETAVAARSLAEGLRPRHEIHRVSESLLKNYDNRPLTDKYAMYQHLMDYWAETMQDDFYELSAAGWKAGNEVVRSEKKTKKGDKETVKQVPGLEGLEGRLIPPALMVQEFFAREQKAIDDLEAQAESLAATMEELREEHGGEDGLLSNATDDKGKISKAGLTKAIKDLGRRNADNGEEYDKLQEYKALTEQEAAIQTSIKAARAELEKKVIAQYPKLPIEQIKTIVIEKKWLAAMEARISTEMENISHRLTRRIKELAERYETPLPQLDNSVAELTAKVADHLKKMGFA